MHFASEAISILVFFLLIFVVLFELFMPYVVDILAPGFVHDAGKMELATSLCRITFPFLLFISVVSFQAGILNSFEKFAAPAVAPVILNLVMIASAFVFVPFSATPAHGFAIGITVAGFLEILWLGYFLKRQNVKIKPYVKVGKILHNPEIKTLFKRIAPGVVGAGIYQINMVVDMILVSLVGTGAISWLYYANRLQQLPLGVVGAAISVALLPILSKQLKAEALEESRQTQDKAVEYGALLSFPAAVMMIVLARPVVNILFEHGRFTSADTQMTAYAVMAYSVGLPCYVIVKALMPNFFARGDTVTPVKYSAVVFLTNFIFNLMLMHTFGHVGIASATTIAAFVSLFQYIYGLKKRGFWQMSGALGYKIVKIMLCSLLMGVAVYGAEFLLNDLLNGWLQRGIILKLSILGGLGIFGLATFLILAKITNVLDISEVYKLIKKKRGTNAKQTAMGKS